MISSCDESYTPKINCLQTGNLFRREIAHTERPAGNTASCPGNPSTCEISCANVSDQARDITVYWASAMASRPRQNPARLRASRSPETPCLRDRLLRSLLLRQPRQLHRLECLLLRRLST